MRVKLDNLRQLLCYKEKSPEKLQSITKQTYFNWISQRSEPKDSLVLGFCEEMNIERKDFDRMLKNTINK